MPTKRVVGPKRKTSSSGSPKLRNNVAGGQTTRLNADEKERDQSDETLESLCQFINQHIGNRPIVWYRHGRDGARAGICIAGNKESRYYLIMTLDHEFKIIDARNVFADIPRNLSRANRDNFIKCIDDLLVLNFQVFAPMKFREPIYNFFGTLIRSRRYTEPTQVARYKFCDDNSDALQVQQADGSEWHRVRVRQLEFRADAEANLQLELNRKKRQLELSELQNRVLQQNVADVTNRLSEQEQRLEGELESVQILLATSKSELDDQKEWKKKAKKILSQKNDEVSNLTDQIQRLNRSSARDTKKIEQLERANKLSDTQKREMRERLEEQAGNLEQQARKMKGLSQQVEVATVDLEEKARTIAAFELEAGAQKGEIRRLEADMHEAYRKIRDHEGNERVYQNQAKDLRKVREENRKLTEDKIQIEQKMGEILGRSLTSPYRSYAFGSEMAELRDQKLEEAVMVCSDSGMSHEEASSLLWRIFMFSYRFFEEKLARILGMLNVSESDGMLARMFIIKMQDAYEKTFDSAGLERAFVEEFSEELQRNVSNPDMLEYVRKCGEICWCVVIHLDPKLHFLPRSNAVDAASPIMFDSSKFKDITGSSFRKGDCARVVAFVLPGLYRVDANAPVSPDALPCVFTKKMPKSSVAEKKPVVPSRESPPPRQVTPEAPRMTREELLNEVEEHLWDGQIAEAKQKLLKLKMYTWKIKIACAEEGCGAVLFHRWVDYEIHVKNGGEVICPQNDMHENLRVQYDKRR